MDDTEELLIELLCELLTQQIEADRKRSDTMGRILKLVVNNVDVVDDQS